MIRIFKKIISQSIAKETSLSSDEILPLIEKPRNPSHGDLAFPCFTLAKLKGRNPAEIASDLSLSLKLPEEVEGVKAIGPFLNFSLSKNNLIKLVTLKYLGEVELSSESSSAKIVIEYSSPNIAKPFHVGHLRATLIGNCLDRVYRALGHHAVSINHLGDWGTQFGFVWAGAKIWGQPEEQSVSALVKLYRLATGLKEQQVSGEISDENRDLPEVDPIARNFFLDLEKGEEYAKDFWQRCVDISLQYLKATYQRLDVSFDHYTGESFYADKIDDIKEELEEASLLETSEGALGVDLGEPLGFARIFTPDGRSLYLTRDLAAAQYRAKTFKFDQALYVVGAPQSLHFQQIKGVLKALNKDYADSIQHIAFGHVLGMKTRGSGNFIELNDFIDEAVNRALKAYQQQVGDREIELDENEVARAVALSAIVFSNLSKTNIKDVQFNWDHALEFQGDTGPYLLYACARVNAIEDRAKEQDLNLPPNQEIDFSKLTEVSAHQLALKLAEYETTLEKVCVDNEPALLANYSLELARLFSRAYQDLKVFVEDESQAHARLALFIATRNVLQSALSLLGLKTVKRM